MRLTALLLALGSILCVDGCGDGTPECKQVIRSCVDSCSITCSAGEEEACVGPDFGGYDIGESERCCICIDPNADYAN